MMRESSICRVADRRPMDIAPVGVRREALTKPIRTCVVAPSVDVLGGQLRQAVRLMSGLKEEPGLEISFIAHNPRFPGVLRQLQRIKYLRTLLTHFVYWIHLLTRLWRYDIVHVFSASYFSYLLWVVPAILIG